MVRFVATAPLVGTALLLSQLILISDSAEAAAQEKGGWLGNLIGGNTEHHDKNDQQQMHPPGKPGQGPMEQAHPQQGSPPGWSGQSATNLAGPGRGLVSNGRHQQGQLPQQGPHPPLPPQGPPPPPPFLSSLPPAIGESDGPKDKEESAKEYKDIEGGEQQGVLPPMPPPPPPGQYWEEFGPPPPQMPPLPEYDKWQMDQMAMAGQQQQQHHQQQAQYEEWEQAGQFEGYATDEVTVLRSELESAAAREADLLFQVTNMTSSLASASDLALGRLHTVDVLTERIAESEARAGAQNNFAKELQANCTALADDISSLNGELKDWEERHAALKNRTLSDAELIKELRREVMTKQSELEDLACAIEEDRIGNLAGRQGYYVDGKKKKRGLFGVLFGGIFGGGDDHEGDMLKAQDIARSTLLQALQTERDNVDELEAGLLTLQQNNSVIDEMVHSRDSLINELNDRIAVFEEDKIVLKAALRQLQKEMKDEAPKTQKVSSDLKKAQEDINAHQAAAKKRNSKHKQEIAALNADIKMRDAQTKETESKMSEIAIYIDQLEERLASFAIARRDIAVREEKCEGLQEENAQLVKQAELLKVQVDEMGKEKTEMKGLVDLLVEERGVLQQDKANLEKRKYELEDEAKMLAQTIEGRLVEVERLERLSSEWRGKYERAEADVQKLQSAAKELESNVEELTSTVNTLGSKRSAVEKAHEDAITLQGNKLEEARQEALRLRSQVDELEKAKKAAVPPPHPPPPSFPNGLMERKVDIAPRKSEQATTPEGIQVAEKILERFDDEDGSPPPFPMPNEDAMTTGEMRVKNETFDKPQSAFTSDGGSNDQNGPSKVSGEHGPKPELPRKASPENLRKVPLRKLRKAFAKTTGMRGIFTPPSHPDKKIKGQQSPPINREQPLSKFAKKALPFLPSRGSKAEQQKSCD